MKIFSKIFQKFSFIPERGGFVKYFFKKKKKKKKTSPLILYHIFGAFVKRFLRKTFFIFREKLLDFTPRICYNIYVR